MSSLQSSAVGLGYSIPEHLKCRNDLKVSEPAEDSVDQHYIIYDPVSDISYSLGKNEWLVCQLFNGIKSCKDIAELLQEQFHYTVDSEKIKIFEHRLKNINLITIDGAPPSSVARDPATGISYGPLKDKLTIPLLNIQPEALINAVYSGLPWLCSRFSVVFGLVLITVALLVISFSFADFSKDVANVYGNGIGWLLWHYPVIIVSIAVHEMGHALACRAYNVRVTSLGIAVYLIMATGWARPVQIEWEKISQQQRAITIIMGPYASLLFSAVGFLIWSIPSVSEFWHTLGIVMMVSSTISLLPTLLPIFNGDTYLALTEYFAEPRIRQRAFQYVKSVIYKKSSYSNLSLSRRTTYWTVVLGTGIGWGLSWFFLLFFISKIVS